MGGGRSPMGKGGGGGKGTQDFPEAFAPGMDFEKSGDVDHWYRTVSSSLQQQWNQFAQPYQTGITSTDEQNLMKDWDPVTDSLYGYVRTSNSFKINEALYDPKNAGKTDDQIFTRKDRYGNLRDLETVQTLDKAINNHVTQADGCFTRYCSPASVQATFGLTNQQMTMLQNAPNMDAKQLKLLNKALSGSTSYSDAYTSTSANRSMNAFKNPGATQSRGFVFERHINVPKGTKAYAVRKNAQESETIFGRKMGSKLTGVSVSSDGHIILHEAFNGYK